MDVLDNLDPQHRAALNWFRENAGKIVPWNPELETGVRLFSTPKGIYKPKDSEYALSVRQTLAGSYPDREPIYRPDGSWCYTYHQEGDEPSDRDRFFTNRGLIRCLEDSIPVGVARQVSPKPNTQYAILGLAQVIRWSNGFFRLESVSDTGEVHAEPTDGPLSSELEAQVSELEQSAYDPDDMEDARERQLTTVARRRGQPAFRAKLLRMYGGKCVITGCNAEAALEAAHITPYRGPETNTPENGILLRADVHTLWDLGLIAIHEETGEVLLSVQLAGTTYEDLRDRRLQLPTDAGQAPSRHALAAHRRFAAL